MNLHQLENMDNVKDGIYEMSHLAQTSLIKIKSICIEFIYNF